MFESFKIVFAGVVIFIFSVSVFALLAGKGEAKGEVMDSWITGGKVGFRLSITNQTSWTGPRLANPNNFIYDGEDKLKVTQGDIVSLIYNSNDGQYVVAERLEFTEDHPGEIDQNSYLFPVVAAISVIAIIIAVFYFIRRKQRELSE